MVTLIESFTHHNNLDKMIFEIAKYILSYSNESLNVKLVSKQFKFISDLLHDINDSLDHIIKNNFNESFEILLNNNRITLDELTYTKAIVHNNSHIQKIILDHVNFNKKFLRSFMYNDECLDIFLDHIETRHDIKRINVGKLITHYSKTNYDSLNKLFQCSKYAFDGSSGSKCDTFNDEAATAYGECQYGIFELLIRYTNLSQAMLRIYYYKSVKNYNKQFLITLCKYGRFQDNFSKLYTIAFIKNDVEILSVLKESNRKCDIFPYPYGCSYDSDDNEYFENTFNDIENVKRAHDLDLINSMNFNKVIEYCMGECFDFFYNNYYHKFGSEQLKYCIENNDVKMCESFINDDKFKVSSDDKIKHIENELLYFVYELLNPKRSKKKNSKNVDFLNDIKNKLIKHPMMNYKVIIICSNKFNDNDVINLYDNSKEIIEQYNDGTDSEYIKSKESSCEDLCRIDNEIIDLNEGIPCTVSDDDKDEVIACSRTFHNHNCHYSSSSDSDCDYNCYSSSDCD
jgi:hypothetical protein